MVPMLARTYGPRYDKYPCYVQPKLNGVRALYSNGVFQSRDEKVWHPNVLAHLTKELSTIKELDGLILDGELYVHGWRLQRINGAVAVNRKEPREDTHEVQFHVFDTIDPKNPDLSFKYRNIESWWQLHALHLPHINHVKFVSMKVAYGKEEVENYFRLFVSLGYEGIMLRPDGPYEPGITPHGTTKRSKFLWKYKSWEDGEFLCTNFVRGEGKADIGVGSLTLLHQNSNTLVQKSFSCGTGFTDEERIDLMKNPPIGKLVRVRYPYLSSSGVPQCPSFVAVMD